MGGFNMHSIEGETAVIHASNGKKYTGLIACQAHSTHVFRGSGAVERNDETMIILLDEDVKSRDDVRALGILNGDYISVEPRCTITESGYVKSRFIDDKACIACVFTMLKYLVDFLGT